MSYMGKAITGFGHRMQMSGILYCGEEKSDTFSQPCGVRVAHSISIIWEFQKQTKYNLSGKGVKI